MLQHSRLLLISLPHLRLDEKNKELREMQKKRQFSILEQSNFGGLGAMMGAGHAGNNGIVTRSQLGSLAAAAPTSTQMQRPQRSRRGSAAPASSSSGLSTIVAEVKQQVSADASTTAAIAAAMSSKAKSKAKAKAKAMSGKISSAHIAEIAQAVKQNVAENSNGANVRGTFAKSSKPTPKQKARARRAASAANVSTISTRSDASSASSGGAGLLSIFG